MMKNTKKFLTLLLTLAMALSLAACGGQKGGAPAGGSDAAQTAGSDLAYVQGKGTLIVGITEFEPMDYQNTDGEWIGFDADMAKAFAESLGVKAEFQVIDWDNKVFELDGKTIDVVWNGMTLTDDVKAAMECSNPYFNNAQVVIVKADKAGDYQTVDSVKGLQFAVENGSAGMEALDGLGLPYTAVDTQAKALMEVASGSSDACVIDLLMAGAMIGEGTSYEQLTYTVSLTEEKYGVGFRSGSDLAEAFNDFYAQAFAAGTVKDIATVYGVQESIIAE